VEPNQFELFDGLKTAKEVWNALKDKHAMMHTGLAAFWTMLEKRFNDGEDMHAHLSYLTLENRKLGKKALDNKFLAQIMLMLLPRESVAWDSLIVSLLQSATDSNPLKSADVMARCIVQHQ
jgi:hypothetical protein